MGKVEVAIQFAGSPSLSSFNATMFECGMINKVRFLAVLKIQSDTVTELSLIPFDREMMMRLSLLNQIAGKLALSQQGIGGNLLRSLLKDLATITRNTIAPKIQNVLPFSMVTRPPMFQKKVLALLNVES